MRSSIIRSLAIAALSTTALVGLATPVFAQDAAAEEADSSEIIVTARRRDETLQSTPVAITAINTSMLENKASTTIGDLQGAAPGLLITQQNSGAQAANLSIRGLTYADIEKSQTPTVGVVVDGVTIGTNTGQLQDVFDIAQIEVLRGPQGTLFGANTIGGVIIVNRSKPTMEPGGKVEFSYGKFNTWSGKAIVNYGDGSTWGVKGWYFHNESDGYYYNTIYKRPGGGGKSDAYGASLLFKPDGSAFDAQLTVENVVQDFEPVNVSLTLPTEAFAALIPARASLLQVANAPSYSRYRAPSATLTLNADMGDVKLTSITGWRHSKEEQTQDFATSGFYYARREQNYTQWSQELRASGNFGDQLDFVVGGYFFSSKYKLTQWTAIGGGALPAPALFSTANPSAVSPGEQVVNGRHKTFALFGDINWAFAENFRLSLGGRWSKDNKKLDNGFFNVVAGRNTTFGLVGAGNANFSKFTPKVGLDWRPNSDTMIYASWSRGYRSGGFSPRAGDATYAGIAFQPETVDAFEVGAKLSAMDNKLLFNIAGFISRYKDMQQNLTVPCTCATGNQTITGNVAGGATIKGVEIEGSIRPMDGLKLSASASVMDSHFNNYVIATAFNAARVATAFADYTANKLIYAPNFSGSLNAEYTKQTSFGKMIANLGLRHISPYDQQISNGPNRVSGITTIYSGNDARVRTKTQDLIDASIRTEFSLGGAEAYFSVFGRNLADVRTTTAAFTVAGLWSFASTLEPRTFGAIIGVKF